jgi:two-component system sensor kinase FixL
VTAADPAPRPHPRAGGDEAGDLREALARLQAEHDRLRESEKMYRFSAEISGRLVWSTDPQGNVVAISRIFKSLTGIGDEETLKRSWLDAVHPDDRPTVLERWRHSLRTGEPFAVEFRGVLPDGSIREALAKAVAARDSGGAIVRWYGSTEDIHEEKRAERARQEAEARLRESEELHRFTLELTRQIVWSVEPDGSGLTLSQRYYDLTGMGLADEPSLSIHPEDRERVLQGWAKSREARKSFLTECRLKTREGQWRWFRVRAAPLRDEQGRIMRWYGTSEDIHEERLAEQARREVEERYRLAVQATNDAVWDYDIVAGTVDWSDNSAEIFGGAAPLGRTAIGWWEERIHPEDRTSVLAGLERAIEKGQERWSASYRFRREDGSYADMLDRGFVIRDEAGRSVRAVGAMVDLTERHRAEAEMRRMQAQLIHVSRVSAMGTMASTLAHELNQPLAAVGNFLSGARRMALARADASAELVAALTAAQSGVQRAGEIVRRLRELVAHGTSKMATEHLPRLIEEAGVLAFVDEELHGVRHRLELDPAAAWVRADRVQVQQVLINLIRNAIEAMAASEQREIVISSRAVADDLIEIAIADTGPGIAAEHLDSLFDQFMTTKAGGMGIGLPICRTIIEAHGGKIRAKNREAGGAVFRFTLPRAIQQPAAGKVR